MPEAPRKPVSRWLITVGILVLGLVFGLIIQNVLLGVFLAAFVAIVWLLATASWKRDDGGVNDESHGIEL